MQWLVAKTIACARDWHNRLPQRAAAVVLVGQKCRPLARPPRHVARGRKGTLGSTRLSRNGYESQCPPFKHNNHPNPDERYLPHPGSGKESPLEARIITQDTIQTPATGSGTVAHWDRYLTISTGSAGLVSSPVPAPGAQPTIHIHRPRPNANLAHPVDTYKKVAVDRTVATTVQALFGVY